MNGLSAKRRRAAIQKTNGRCWYCGCTMDEDRIHIDHVIPRANGGSNKADNLVAACPECNSMKGSRSVEEFRLIARFRCISMKFTFLQMQWLAENAEIPGLQEETEFFGEEMNHGGWAV